MVLLGDILNHMAHGNGVAPTPLHSELTTRQAADLLQDLRTQLVQLLDDGVACRMVGSHRRVRVEDLLPTDAKWNPAPARRSTN